MTRDDGREAARPPRSRAVSFMLGAVFVLAGIPMLVCPGPGVAVILAGLGLIAYGLTGRRRPD